MTALRNILAAAGLAGLLLAGWPVWAADVNLADCDAETIQAGHDAANAGDVLICPAGTANWDGNDQVVITKEIDIRGPVVAEGTPKTLPTGVEIKQYTPTAILQRHTAGPNEMFRVQANNVDISYLEFRGHNESDTAIQIRGGRTGWQIHRSVFRNLGRGVFILVNNIAPDQNPNGVIFFNTFVDLFNLGSATYVPGYAVAVIGTSETAWAAAEAGDGMDLDNLETNAVFIEQNYAENIRHIPSTNGGSRVVTRYNLVNGTSPPAGVSGIDAHGQVPANWPRGSLLSVYYRNRIEGTRFDTGGDVFGGVGIRGGGALIFENDCADTISNCIVWQQDEGDTIGEEPYTRVYAWANSRNGVIFEDISVGPGPLVGYRNQSQETLNTDWFLGNGANQPAQLATHQGTFTEPTFPHVLRDEATPEPGGGTIENPVLIDVQVPGTTGGNVVLTVPAGGTPEGATIFVFGGAVEASTGWAVADTVTNTYVEQAFDDDHASINMEAHLFRCDDCGALAEGNTITISWADSNTVTRSAIAFYVVGLDPTDPVDAALALEEFAATSTPATSNIVTADTTIKLGFYFKVDNDADTEDADFTNIGTAESGAGNRRISAAYRIGDAETVNYAPTLFAAESGFIAIGSFSAAPGTTFAMTADAGSYSVTGSDLGLFEGVTLTVEPGSYSLTGAGVATSTSAPNPGGMMASPGRMMTR